MGLICLICTLTFVLHFRALIGQFAQSFTLEFNIVFLDSCIQNVNDVVDILFFTHFGKTNKFFEAKLISQSFWRLCDWKSLSWLNCFAPEASHFFWP